VRHPRCLRSRRQASSISLAFSTAVAVIRLPEKARDLVYLASKSSGSTLVKVRPSDGLSILMVEERRSRRW
jgi:hypothetical protein